MNCDAALTGGLVALALLVAALLIWRRAPFVVVALAAALTAAGLRVAF